MVQVKYGALVTELKGKIGGLVFKGGYSAPSIQAIGKPRQIATGYNQLPKAILANMAARWKLITSAQRSGWNALALTWPFINCFGATYYGSGFQVFQSVNLNLNSVGLAMHPDAADLEPLATFTSVIGTWSNIVDNSFVGFTELNSGGDNRFFMQSCLSFSPGQYHAPAKLHLLNYFGNTYPYPQWPWESTWNVRFEPNAHLMLNRKIMIRIKAVNINSGQFLYAPDLYISSPV